ncbi:hypothetical protein FB157_13616 [Streptomyces sp. BK340]|nr:hypothetical protein FB157_13616 [Streptomyces sp. BK340]
MSAPSPRIDRKIALAATVPFVAGIVAAGNALASPASPSSSSGHSSVVLEHDAQVFADAAAKNPPIYTLSYADARKALDTAQSGPVPLPPADVSHRTLPVGPTR